MARSLLAWAPPVAWMALIFALSSRSSVPKAPGISPQLIAAIGHLFVYAVLAILLYRALLGVVQNPAVGAWIAWLIATLYGVSDEIHQYFVPGRYATVGDVLLDAIGAAIGIVAYRWMVRRSMESEALI